MIVRNSQRRPATMGPDDAQATALALIPRSVVMRHDLVPLEVDVDADTLVVGTPSDSYDAGLSDEAIADLRRYSKRNQIEVIGLTLESVQRIMEAHYPAGMHLVGDGPVAWQKRFFDYVEAACARNADDVVLDHGGNNGVISLHADGHGRIIDRISADDLQHIIRAALISAHVTRADDLSEPHRGRLSHKRPDGRVVDLRLTTTNTHSEQSGLSVRLVPDKDRFARLADLGMRRALFERYSALIAEFVQLVIGAGPPSHGKSTLMRASLYELWLRTQSPYLRSLEAPLENIYEWLKSTDALEGGGKVSIETTIEHWLAWPIHGAFFGEVRDGHTLSQVMRLALADIPTYTTTHGESAPQSIWKFFNEGVDPYTLGQVLTCVVGQRLFAVLCEDCAEDVPLSDPLAARFTAVARKYGQSLASVASEPRVRRPNPERVAACTACTNGYLGRTPVFDLLVVNDKMRDLIYAKSPANVIAAADKEYEPMWVSAADLVLSGRTSPEEATRWLRLPASSSLVGPKRVFAVSKPMVQKIRRSA